MALEFSLLATMAVGLAVKWFTTLGLKDRKEKLAEANEQNLQARARVKALVGDVQVADSEIKKLRRHIRTVRHRIERLSEEHAQMQRVAAQRAEMDKEKLRLAEEVKRKRGR